MRQRLSIVLKREGGRGDHIERGECLLYIDETPRILTRGKNKAGKRRQGKQRPKAADA
jgi:hypothetical protein